MELLNLKEFEEYIRRNFQPLIDLESSDLDTEMSGFCNLCQKDVFLKVHSRSFQESYTRHTLPRFVSFLIECPKCRRQSFIHTVEFFQIIRPSKASTDSNEVEEQEQEKYRYYELYRIPTGEYDYANQDIPEIYTSLRDTVAEASFCLSHSRYVAAAILFRRAIQILAKDILGAVGKKLHAQLEWLRANKNKLGIDLTDVFHDNSTIIKDIGNQGAHPDDDITLHNFTKEDANGLHDLFISIVHEVFIKPTKLKALQDELKKSRKLA